MTEGKLILDATCGSRMMWFNKKHPDAIYIDKRAEVVLLCDGREMVVNPDIECDFTDMPFDDNSFHLVVFDPPHLKKLGKNTWMAQKYGRLLPTWETDIKGGFDECMRVLKPFGTLVFKWNEAQINLNQVLSVIGREPLFGHTSGRHGKTKWMVFMKK